MVSERKTSETAALRRVDRAPMYEAILDRLREYAQNAGLQRGHRLPSERDLAEQLGTSRASVKQALVVLEVQGLVETRHGGGTFLLRDELSTESVTTLIARQARLPEVMEARAGLECQLAELAARRRTDDDLRFMDDALAQMAVEVNSQQDGAEGDRLFHNAVASAGRNPLLSRFLFEIEHEIEESRQESLRQPGRPAQSLRQHRNIVEAIRRQDPSGARRAMRQHLTSVGKVRLLSWAPPGEETTANKPE
jgi:GntR family transcriptional repressor for pyruvate dehydrogenase complex